MTKRWWKECVVYQIYPRSFMDSNGDGIGDLNGIIKKMDYLLELGIDAIWLSPIYQSPNDDNGYDISDYKAIMEEFGTMDDFDRLLQSAHEHGIKIIMDLVVNHTSDEHPWFVESKKSKDNPYRDYYIWREPKNGGYPNNWGSVFSGPAWEYDEASNMYYLHLFSRKQPDLNWDNPAVRNAVYDMMNWWVDKGVDGFRMDVMSLISKPEGLPDGKLDANGFGKHTCANGPHVHEYLKEMRRRVLNRADLMTVGEGDGVTIEEATRYANSDESELNMVFQFDHMRLDVDPKANTKWSVREIDLREFKKILTDWQKGLEEIAWNSLYLENHDRARCVSRFGSDKEEYRELSAKMLGTCIHMMEGTPYVYQGEELGMTNAPFRDISDFRDLDSINGFYEMTGKGIYTEEQMMNILRYRSRDNARTPMQWDDSDNAGFTSGRPWIMVNPNYKTINAKEQLARDDSVFHYYQKLIRLRHEKEIIVYGSYDLLYPDDKDLFIYTRTLGGQKLLVVCNFSLSECPFSLPKEFLKGNILISNYPDVDINSDILLRPYETFVIEKQKAN